MKIYLYIGALVSLGVFLVLLKKKPSFIKSGIYGLAGLTLVNIASVFTGIGIGINLLTVSFAALLGIPGVILMLVVKGL